MSETEMTRREDRMGRISGHEKAEEQPLAPGTPPGATDARIQKEGNTPRKKTKTKKQGRKWERANTKQRAQGIGNVHRGRKACKREKIFKNMTGHQEEEIEQGVKWQILNKTKERVKGGKKKRRSN